VRYIAAANPQAPLLAGSRASLSVFTDRPDYRWLLRRAGTGFSGSRHAGHGRTLRLRAPRRPGVYVLTLSAGRNRFRMPLAVRSATRPRVLAVLPTVDWLAANPFDANQDGWADTLATAGSVGIGRPAAGALPAPTYTTSVEPLLRILDGRGFRYDVTTDLALSRGSGPALAGHSGVLFLGPEPYVADDLAVRLREYVQDGGRVATVVPDGFHREVRLDRGRLTKVGGRRSADSFGEATRLRTTPLGSLAVFSDRIGFFAGTGGRIGQFTRIETSEQLPGEARLLAGAGLETERPALVVYRLGRGVVARMGADGFVLQAAAGLRSVAPMTVRLWTLLSR
jgi:hypothetical protein